MKDDFIGEEFHTQKGGVLKVIGKEVIKRKVVYLCKCSVCSRDKELFPFPFKITKASLLKGVSPCGCSKSPKWKKFQYKIRIERLCKDKNYTFLGFNKNYKGVDTKLNLKCNLDGHQWGSTNIDGLFNSKIGCPACGKEVIRLATSKKDSDCIKMFLSTGKFPTGYAFKRNKNLVNSTNRKEFWDCTCPICSNDEYVKAGVCTGIFTTRHGTLRSGSLPCRCSELRYLWTKEQREYKIKDLCEKEGLTFLGWIGEYSGNFSKFQWKCKEGHLCERSTVAAFINKRSRCDICSRLGNNFGYYKTRKREQDNLYVILLEKGRESFIKVGRSFDVEKRIKRIKEESGYHITIVKTLKSTHENVFRSEQLIHKTYKDYQYTPETYFEGITECFDKEIIESVVLYSESILL